MQTCPELHSIQKSALEQKPPNEPTTPVLSVRDAKRAALGSGPLGAWPYVLPSFGSGSVTPDVRYRELTERKMGR